MATDFETWKTCVAARLNLDREAIDVLWIQPIKDLCNWWNNQSEATKKYIDFFTKGIGGALLLRYLKTSLGTALDAIIDVLAPALAAAVGGIALGLDIAAFIECGIFDVPTL